MTTTQPEQARLVTLRTDAGRYHIAAEGRVAGTYLTHESCNLDDAGELLEVEADEALNAPPGSRCGRCFELEA